MKQFLKIAVIASLGFLTLTGCSRTDLSTSSTQVTYAYQQDINKSERLNPGSSFVRTWIGDTKYNFLRIDYGLAKANFPIKYTLPDKENKILVESNAVITFALTRNPHDNADLQFKDDEYAKFFANKITPINDNGVMLIHPKQYFDLVMNETLDRSFRGEFTNTAKYPDFDAIEAHIIDIRDSVKVKLTEAAKDYRIEIIGLSIESPVVPDPIMNSRNEMLKMKQEALNTTTQLDIKSKQAAHRMAVSVREAINDVALDNIAGQVDKGYLMIKTFNRAIDEKAPLNLTITPDFMRYLESDKSGMDKKERSDYINTLDSMSQEELIQYFSRSSSKE